MMKNTSLCANYSLVKHNLVLEKYLKILNRHKSKNLTRFRWATFELLTMQKKIGNIISQNCTLCKQEQSADEYHLLLKCTKLHECRKQYLKTACLECPSFVLFDRMLNTGDVEKLKNLSHFCREILLRLQHALQNPDIVECEYVLSAGLNLNL